MDLDEDIIGGEKYSKENEEVKINSEEEKQNDEK